jgi:hypothetical protein
VVSSHPYTHPFPSHTGTHTPTAPNSLALPLSRITHPTAAATTTTRPIPVYNYSYPDATAACAMGDSSVAGALVPSVPKPEPAPSGDTSAAAAATTAALAMPEEAGMRAASASPQGPAEEGEGPADRDLLCPICMAVIKDAFLTACGHSFCYMCIVTHLSNKSDCPCCGHYLTKAQLYPNFLLDKVSCLF